MKLRLLLILSCWFGLTTLFAQDVVIRGRVIDKRERVAVIGANVIEYDNGNRVINGTTCDVNGDFVLTLKNPSNQIRVAMIGYTTKTIVPGSQGVITVELDPKDIQVGEVIVTARKREEMRLTNIEDRDVTSASVKIDMSQIREAGALSAADALQGKVTGLDIISNSGDPGSGSALVIRGISGMGNNSPLVVIDGIRQQPIKNYQGGETFDLSSADQEDIGNLLNIALQDIKSIEVLKDAASTAVYGAEGADGVLIIETYKGRLGKVQFDYAYKFNVLKQPPSIPMLNGDEYVMQQLEAWHNRDGVFEVPREIAYDRDYVDFYNYSQNTDWIGAITRPGFTNDHYFSLSGGGEKSRYFTSFSYIAEKGTTFNADAKTFISRINLDYFLSKKTLFSIQFSYTNENVGGNVEINNGTKNVNVREMAYMKAPNMSIWEYDPYGNLTGEYFNPINSYQGTGGSYWNPVAVARLGKNDRKANRLQNNFNLSYNINRWLKFRETLSFQFGGSKQYNYLPYNAMGTDWLEWTVNKAEESNNINTSINTETQIAFDVPFSDSSAHTVTGSVAWITNQSQYEWANMQSRNLPSVNQQDPATGGRINWIGDGSGENRNVGVLANINYKYKDRYLITGILRADAYSLFGENNRWGLFKGVSFGWRFGRENLLNSVNWLGKESMVRLSWGVSGKPPETGWGLPDVNYARFATYQSGSYNYGRHTGVINTQIKLDNLKWQSVTQTDIGAELYFFKDRLYIEGDVYQKVTNDLVFAPYLISSSSGFENVPYYNGGKLENKGWELSSVYYVIRNKDLKVSVNFNISHNENAFISFPGNFNKEKNVTMGDGKYPLRVEEGQAVGTFFGFRYLGVYPTDEDAFARDAEGNLILDYEGLPVPITYGSYKFQGGDAKYADLNHDGKIDLNDVEYIGDSNPDYIGGFGLSTSYKNFDLSCGFHYRIGFDIVNRTAINTQGMNNKNNQSKAVMNRWRVEGDNHPNMLPRSYMYHEANNLGSDRYVEKGDYLRLLNLTLGYRFSPEFCRKLNLRSLGLTLGARKLVTFTNYTGEDPEISLNAADPFWVGEDESQTPPPRIYTLGVTVGF